MNEQTRAEKIDLFLRALHLYSMKPRERKELSERLANCGLTVSSVRQIWEEAKVSASDEEHARGLLAKTLQTPSLALEVVADLEDRRATIKGGPTSEPASMQYVAPGNPWGWKNPEPNRQADHGRPGEWNPYRQSFNMTEAERREAKSTDCRRQGCSRYEMVGEFDSARVKKGKDVAADPFYDKEGVELAQARFSADTPAVKQPDIEKVYGE